MLHAWNNGACFIDVVSTLHPHHTPCTTPCTTRPTQDKKERAAVDSLLQEVLTMHSCNGHPHIARFCGVVLPTDTSPLQLVMEYYERGTLAQLIQRARQKVGGWYSTSAPATATASMPSF
jgi:serine/threonine protein kinase